MISPVAGLMSKSPASGPEREYDTAPAGAVVSMGVPMDVPAGEFSGRLALRACGVPEAAAAVMAAAISMRTARIAGTVLGIRACSEVFKGASSRDR